MKETSLSEKTQIGTEFVDRCFSTSQAVYLAKDVREAVKELKERCGEEGVCLWNDVVEIFGEKLTLMDTEGREL